MKSIQTTVIRPRPIKVSQNTLKHSADVGFIQCASTKEVLHVGQPKYIQRVAKQRYGVIAKF